MIEVLMGAVPVACAWLWRLLRDWHVQTYRRGLYEGRDMKPHGVVYVLGQPMIVASVSLQRNLNQGDLATVECVDPVTHVMSMALDQVRIELRKEDLARAT